jgi:hypothetical protein
MTGPEHYRRAEELLAESRRAVRKRIEPDWLMPADLITEAQVHATLALAATQVDGAAVMRLEDRDEWDRATGRLEVTS